MLATSRTRAYYLPWLQGSTTPGSAEIAMGALTIDREDDVVVVTFDLRGESVNKFTARVFAGG